MKALAAFAALSLAASLASAGEASLRFSGVLGQSQEPPAAPFPNAGFDGCFLQSRTQSLWAASGRKMIEFKRQGGAWRETGSCELPCRAAGAVYDGEAAYFLEGKAVWKFDPDSKKAVRWADASAWKEEPALLAVAPKGLSSPLASKFKALLASKDGALAGFRSDGAFAGEPFKLEKLEGSCPYTAICFDPQGSGLFAASYYPDTKVYRLEADGSKAPGSAWPQKAFVSKTAVFEGAAWLLENDGDMRPATSLKSLAKAPSSLYQRGFAKTPSGFVVACSQGLLDLAFDGAAPQRIGGTPEARCLAVSPEGELLAAIEDGQRLLRLQADGSPDSPFSSGANEPFRCGGAWKDKAAAIVWSGDRYYVLDSTEGRLLSFDTTQMGYTQKPWLEILPAGSLKKASALTQRWPFLIFSDAKGLWLFNVKRSSPAKKLAAEGAEGASSLALNSEGVLLVAGGSGIEALKLDLENGSVAGRLWRSGLGSLDSPSLALLSESRAAVALPASGELALIDIQTGTELFKSGQDIVPQGMKPGALCAMPPWLYAYDSKGFRILRFKLEEFR